MDLPIENTYGFFRVDERCKKLERTVKMLQLKELEKKNTENYTLDTRTNISSINGDAFDSSYAYSSKLGSEIVSSSANMKNLFVHKKNLLNHNIATSSVKNSPDSDPTRAIMPPPKSIPTFNNSSRKNTLATCEASVSNTKHSPTKLELNFYSTSSAISSIKCPNSLEVNSPIQYATDNENSQKSMTDITKPDRIFERWKVVINDRGQLIIKGILKDTKKNVRSKPVVRRINASVVQSCFNHIYELQGRIYDDHHELPEYIRKKFNNGFPDDWENDFQLWRSYISGGCKSSFRWPTRVTDSDDDIKSEITELPYSEEAKKSHNHTKSRRDSIRIERTLKNPPETISKISKMLIENPKSPVPKTQNIPNQSSIKTISLSEDSHDKAAAMNSFLGNIHDKHSSNLSTTNHTIDGDISSMVDTILNYKNCSIEYIDKIIEKLNCYKNSMTSKPKNLPANITNNNVNMCTTERAPLTERTSNNSNVTVVKVENIENHTPKYLSSHSVQNHSYDFDSVSKPSPCGSNVPSIGKVRRKLYKKNDDSSELSDSDTEIQRRRSPRIVSKMYKNRQITKTASNKKYLLHRVNDDSDDDCVPKKTIYTNAENTHANKPTNEVNTQVNEVDFEGFRKPIPKNQSKNISNNPRNTNLPPSKSYRERNASSPSTITGFLVNYDSCVSISEDDRRVRTPRSKLDNKRTVNDIDGKTLSSFKLKLNRENANVHYDSSVSITEDERNYVGNKMNGADIKKQVLQEPNIQCFQQMLKRNLKQNTNSTGFFDKKHLQDYPTAQKQSSSLQSKEPKDFAFSKHISTNSNENKENTSDQTEKEKQANQNIPENHQINFNKTYQLPEKIKPSIVSVEEVSYEVDDLLFKKCHREESIKNDSLKNKKKESGSKRNNDLPMHSTTNNVSNITNSKSAEIDFKMACKDVSIQLKDIKDTLQLKPNAKKNVNNDRTKEQVIFGSEENPKQLTSWCPNVIKKTDSTFGLVFEGKLLNEAGLVVDKKFRTGFVEKRVSSKVIKTDINEFYQLVGDFTDTKHVVPKELYKNCFHGCPGQIKEFCEQWRSIIDKLHRSDGITNESDQSNESINSINMQGTAQSSRGRRILPPLSYWSGERLSIKGDSTIYTPPTSFCTSFELPKKDRSLQVKKNISNSEKQDKGKNSSNEKDNIVNEQVTENNKALKETTRSKGKQEETKLRRSFRKRKELMKINMQDTDSDSISEEECPVSKRRRNGYGDAQKQRRSQESLNKNDTKKANFDKNEEKKSKRGKNFSDKQNNSPIKSNQVTIKYYQISSRKNDLSEYESSIVG